MREVPEPASPTSSQLHSALLDYFRAPGKYQLTLRQPALLFGAIREILQLAAGRGSPEPGAATATHEVREAAAFFIRAALLYPGADHYAVLGLPPGTPPVELKERYRLLMRLIHPDYAQTGSVQWPADAAVRVNRAYEILASPVLRQEYDEQLAGLRTQRPAEPSMAARRPALSRAPVDTRGLRGNRKLGWTLVAFAALVAAALLMPSQEAPQLVQKATPRVQAERAPLPAPARSEREPEPAVLTVTESLPPAASDAPQPGPAAVAAAVSPTPAPPVVAAIPLPAPAPPAAPSTRPVTAPAATVPPAPALAAARPAPPAQAPPPPARLPATVAARPAPDPRSGIRMTEVPLQPPPAPVPPPLAPVRPAIEPALALAPAQPVPPAPPASPAAAAAPAVTRVSTAPPVAAGPTLAEAQPVLTQLLQVLESGSGEQLLRLLDGDARHSPAAQALSRQYEQIVRGGRPIRLTQVDFKGEPRDGTLLVTGRIRLHAGEPTVASHGERLLLRAEFTSRGGRVQLTGLSGGAD